MECVNILQTIAAMTTKVDKLEKLCRALQTERQTLRKQIENGTVAPTAAGEPSEDEQQKVAAESDLPEADKELSLAPPAADVVAVPAADAVPVEE